MALTVWPKGKDEPIVQQMVQRRDVFGELRRLEATLGGAQLIREVGSAMQPHPTAPAGQLPSDAPQVIVASGGFGHNEATLLTQINEGQADFTSEDLRGLSLENLTLSGLDFRARMSLGQARAGPSRGTGTARRCSARASERGRGPALSAGERRGAGR